MSKIRIHYIPFDAIQWDGTDETAEIIMDWTAQYNIISIKNSNYPFITIYTIEDPVSAVPGDWVVKDITDRFHILNINAVPNDN